MHKGDTTMHVCVRCAAKIVENYMRATSVDPSGGYLARGGKNKLRHVWRVDRHGSAARFTKHDGMDNRHLLWHGTNVAVVAAILKSGLRIFPHSGGRVGRGIYLADSQVVSLGVLAHASRLLSQAVCSGDECVWCRFCRQKARTIAPHHTTAIIGAVSCF